MDERFIWNATWAELDPAGRPFDRSDQEAALLTGLLMPLIPDPEVVGYYDREKHTTAITRLLTARYGFWAAGWNWSPGEGGLGSGVVDTWCCAGHSMHGTREETARLIVRSLREWRDWLEDLAGRFAALAPPADGDPAAADPWYWERACTRLVTLVVDRTHSESGWHGMCTLVLEWFLAAQGIGAEQAARIVEAAVGGRFESWVEPRPTVIAEVGERFATEIGGME
ncbi:hypothetical protein [Actinomadura macrotermitis]|uniref:Uncharacterized protein n=1 Tax=Actinomadura macrotermitis TaxID=2585200 RepID=A0A7K0C5Z0_9ACTN|nr:hypothetical protein [Actinomadura macrotermitis]MQY08512.1 hypothetical protein [Actinomadura macrotermitis]